MTAVHHTLEDAIYAHVAFLGAIICVSRMPQPLL